jgi:hypothetical protein
MNLTLKKCHKCGKDIHKEERAVLLKTYDYKKVYEELDFHLTCWIQDLKEKDEKRAVELYTTSMKSSMGILKNIMPSMFKGSKENESIIIQKGIE